MKKVRCIFGIIAIINIVIAISLIFNGSKYILFVNFQNKKIVKEALKDEIKNTNFISKISYKTIWLDEELDVYYYFSKKDTVYGGVPYELKKYIEDNGYKTSTIIFVLFGSSVFLILCINESIKEDET